MAPSGSSEPPRRLRLSRARGWRKPPGTVVVARPSRWGNPYRIGDPHPDHGGAMTRAEAVGLFRRDVEQDDDLREQARRDLAGRHLACWCPLDEPCHADVLLEIAGARRDRVRCPEVTGFGQCSDLHDTHFLHALDAACRDAAAVDLQGR